MTIGATLSLETACRRTWDVIVVGAGPAGALAAKELAERKVAVLLVDRAAFPRWKVCGCCLNGHALAVLRETGLASSLIRHGAVPVESIRLASAGYFAQVPLSGGMVLSRQVLDAEIIKAAVQSGAGFLPQTMVSLARHASHRECRYLELNQGSVRTQNSAHIVISAEGLGGNLLAREGHPQVTMASPARIGAGVIVPTASPFYTRGQIFMACGSRGYMGAVRLEDDRVNLAAAFDPSWMRRCGGLGNAAAALLAEVGWPALPHLSEAPWRGTPTLTRRPRRRAAERLFVIGDAAGYIEPFTGEGIAWALQSGRLVADLAARGVNGWHPRLVRQWEAIYERGIAQRQRVCQTAAAVLRRSWLTAAIIRLLAAAPALALPLTRYLGTRVVAPR